MSDPTTHPFIRPGQVHPDQPPPDNCMTCGLPEAAHDELEALKALFPAWHIVRALFGSWSAQWKSPSGLSIHVVYGESVADLHRRLQVVEDARGDNE